MIKDVIIKYQGHYCASVNFSRSLGIAPDIGTVTIPKDIYNEVSISPKGLNDAYKGYSSLPQRFKGGGLSIIEVPNPPQDTGRGVVEFNTSGNLYIEHRNTGKDTKVSLDYIFLSKGGIRTIEQSETSKASMFEIEITDERRLWQEMGVLQGDYNVEDEFGVEVDGNFFREATLGFLLDNGTVPDFACFLNFHEELKLWTLEELVEKCAEALPNPRGGAYPIRWLVGSFIKDYTPINIKAGGGRLASEVLGELLDKYSLYLSLQFDGTILIVERHAINQEKFWEYELTEGGYLIQREDVVQPLFRPFGVVVTSDKRTINEWTVSDLTPVIQFGSKKEYLDLKDSNGTAKVGDIAFGMSMAEVGKQALLTYSEKEKAFQGIKPVRSSGALSEKETKELIAALQQQAFKYFRINDAPLPMLEERTIMNDGGKVDHAPIEVKATYIYPLENKDPSQALWGLYDDSTIPGDKQPSFDLKAGVAKFPYVVGTMQQTDVVNLEEVDYSESLIEITYQYVGPDYYSYLIGSPTYLSAVLKIDFQEYDTPDYKNKVALDAEAEDAALAKFAGPNDFSARHLTFASVWPVDNDGMRTRVTWEASADAIVATTKWYHGDYINDMDGRPGIGEKEEPRRTGRTGARIP